MPTIAGEAGGISEADIRTRSREIFQYMAGTELCAPSAATALADRMEDSIRDRGWRAEMPLGTEAELAGRFETGRRMVRQAGRILSARGAVQVRRGKEGGFFVARVDRAMAVSGLAGALATGHTLKHKAREAREVLTPVLHGRDGCASALVRDALAFLETNGEGRPSAEPEPARRAERLARAIVRDFGAATAAEAHVALGSLCSLSERYSSGLPVVIQAIRLLEDNGTVAIRRGRRGGIFLLSTGPTASLRTVNAYLGSNDAAVEECDHLVRGINICMLGLAERRSRHPSIEAAVRALQAMEQASTPTEVGVRWYLLQRCLCDLADNSILHLLVRSLAAHVVLSRLRRAELTSDEARELIRCSQQIVHGLLSGNGDGNGQAHLRCQQVLEQCW